MRTAKRLDCVVTAVFSLDLFVMAEFKRNSAKI